MVTEYLKQLDNMIIHLNVPYHMRDEAYSEGLVIIAEAMMDYDPERGVPEPAWINKRLKWRLFSWMKSEFVRSDIYPLFETDTSPMSTESSAMLNDLLYRMINLSNLKERTALIASVCGYHPSEISSMLRVNGQQLKQLVTSARNQLAV